MLRKIYRVGAMSVAALFALFVRADETLAYDTSAGSVSETIMHNGALTLTQTGENDLFLSGTIDLEGEPMSISNEGRVIFENGITSSHQSTSANWFTPGTSWARNVYNKFIKDGLGELVIKDNFMTSTGGLRIAKGTLTLDGVNNDDSYRLDLYGDGTAFSMINNARMAFKRDVYLGADMGSTSAGKGVTVNLADGTMLGAGQWMAIAESVNTSATVNMADSTLSAQQLFVGYDGDGVLNQSGGSVSATERVSVSGRIGYDWYGHDGEGIYNMTGGTLATPNLSIGASKKGTMNQSGGSATVSTQVDVGRDGSGWLGISGGGTMTAPKTSIGTTANGLASGLVRLDADGTLASPFVDLRSGYLVWNGGTWNADGHDGTLLSRYGAIGRSGANLQVGPNGGTLNIGSADAELEPGLSKTGFAEGAALTKTGSGTLTVKSLPANGGLSVAEGKIVLDQRDEIPGLLHRWSFNGDLRDSVTGKEAAIGGTASKMSYVSDENGDNWAKLDGCAINLGSYLCPTNNSSFALEFWARLDDTKNWSRLIELGKDSTQALLGIIWRSGSKNSYQPRFQIFNGSEHLSNASFDQGADYHLLVSYNRKSDGTWEVCAYINKVGDNSGIIRYTKTSNVDITSISQDNAWLGRELASASYTKASYSEVRVWNRSFTEAEFVELGNSGANQFPTAMVMPPQLAHRWSFNGNLTDAVTLSEATYSGSADMAYNESGTGVTLAGGTYGTSAINLGPNVLPRGFGPVTIEIWGKKLSNISYGRIFDFGDKDESSLHMTWDLNINNITSGRMYVGAGLKSIGGNSQSENIGEYVANTTYHIALVIEPQADGTTKFKGYKQDADGNTISTCEEIVTADWSRTIPGCNFGTCYLGRSTSKNKDKDANAEYDEVRIWQAALSEEQLTANAVLGPDTLPTSVSEPSLSLSAASGATMDLGGTTVTAVSLGGGGTITNGTVTVTDGVSVAANETLKVACALTLDGATLTVENPQAVADNWIVMEAVDGGAISGTFADSNLPHSHDLVYRDGRVRAVRRGFVLVVR